MELISSLYQQAAMYLWILLAAGVVGVATRVASVHSRMRDLTDMCQSVSNPGTDSEVTSILMARLNRVEETSARISGLSQMCHQLEHEVLSSVQRIGLVRFSPFEDTAGDQSFALALLDSLGTGVIISSLHGRLNTRVYAKAITRGEPSHPLTVEEEEALTIALQDEEMEKKAKVSLQRSRRAVVG